MKQLLHSDGYRWRQCCHELFGSPGMDDLARTLCLTVNGRAVELSVDPIKRLSEVLREDLGLTGTKIGCHAGDCGACTVLVGGKQVCACLMAAGQAANQDVLTVE